MPLVNNTGECLNDILMDSEPLGNLAEGLDLFTRPLGCLIPGTDLRKTYRDTNMFLPGVLCKPEKFLVKGIRCAFLDEAGRVVPVNEAIYWDTTLRFFVSRRSYWHSPVAHVVDPMILTTPEQWAALKMAQKCQLVRRFSDQAVSEFVPAERIFVPTFPDDVKASISFPAITGILIETQESFGVQIEHGGKWPKHRIVCVLNGTLVRPVQ
jgi:hypothetical protein